MYRRKRHRRTYRKNTRRTLRKTNTLLREILLFLQSLLRQPFVKTVLLIFVILTILLVPVPWLITKITPSADPGHFGKSSQTAPFALAEIPKKVTVWRTASHKIETVDFEDYVKGVVSSEMPSSFPLEALKAQSVAARTYSLGKIQKSETGGNPKSHPKAPVCDSTHCQVYQNPSDLKSIKGTSWMEGKDGWKKICKAADATRGQLLYYQGELVQQALFHSSSGGKTENCQDVFAASVPYLVSVDSPYEDEATHQNEQHTFTVENFAKKIRAYCPKIAFGDIKSSNIKIISRSTGGNVEKMQIGNGLIEGRTVREALELPSTNFTIKISAGKITFTSSGSGHGVGMSQYGASGMAKKGYNYKDILAHYYQGTEVW